MSNEPTIPVAVFRSALKTILAEVFDESHGYIFDKSEQLLTTLAGITADEASERVSPQTASIAAQVNHLAVYIEAIAQGPGAKVDWEASWTDVTTVTDEDWAALIERVRNVLAQVRAFVDRFDDWSEDYIGGAIALAAHTTYHLGEIRTGIGVIRDRRD